MFASDLKSNHSPGHLILKPLLLDRQFEQILLFTLNICHIWLILYPEFKNFIQNPIVLHRQINSKKMNPERDFDPQTPHIP